MGFAGGEFFLSPSQGRFLPALSHGVPVELHYLISQGGTEVTLIHLAALKNTLNDEDIFA